jgi:hypothetical protein
MTMPAWLKLHYLTQGRKENWEAGKIRECIRRALHEHDMQKLRIAELEKAVKAIPRFQGMTELS